jgi:hypothetical protein
MIRLTAKNREFRKDGPVASVVDPMALDETPTRSSSNPTSLGADFNFELLVRQYVPDRLREIETELQLAEERCMKLRAEASMLERVHQAIG